MNSTTIEWTEKTWNPVTGCTKVSQGCKNCYAERIYERWNGHGTFGNIICHQDRLDQPSKWKTPSMIFVNSMSDLFHEQVPMGFIMGVFEAMCRAPQHTYQILTKRPAKMLEFMIHWAPRMYQIKTQGYPMRNVWLGVSCEDQQTADERIPILLKVPTFVRFLSCEPLLGPINLIGTAEHLNWTNKKDHLNQDQILHGIDWVIVGGESGPGARPMHPDWVRSIRDQCKDAGVPFFFKQWGEWSPEFIDISGKKYVTNNDNNKMMYRVGKNEAGRMLDGKIYSEMPI